jgi:hypothetical protein
MSGSHVERNLKGSATVQERMLAMSEFKQQIDPLADAKAWLAQMEKTLAKLAAERILQNEHDARAECRCVSPNCTMPKAATGSQKVVTN